MVLKLLNMDHPVQGKETAPLHPIFTDPVFAASQTWRLSTSGLQEGNQLMGTGFGAAFKNGYGINYMAGRTLVKFGIEVKNDEESLSAQDIGGVIVQTLQDLRDLCERVNMTQDGSASASTARL
jgi:carnitine O-acetyltransferase